MASNTPYTLFPTISFIPFNDLSTEPSNKFKKITLKGDSSGKFEFTISGDNFSSLVEQMNFYSYKKNKKEQFFFIAIDNLIKKNEFLQLTLQFEQGHISGEEYTEEIETNSDRYIIKMKPLETTVDLVIISEIVKNIQTQEITVDEVSELFSIEPEGLNKKLTELKLNNS